MQQLPLFQTSINKKRAARKEGTPGTHEAGLFSHNCLCNETERLKLENLYADIFLETDKFSRKTVSFQANKAQTLHNWIHYREGFSSELVELLMAELGTTEEGTILDPFAGSATTLIQAMLHNYPAIGIELLPNCHLAWQAKSSAFKYDIEELENVKHILATEKAPANDSKFPHIKITQSAFSPTTEKEIVDYALWFDQLNIQETTKTILRALLMSILESVSYTRKDGQYLRWDMRAEKIVERNQKRVEQGKKPFKGIHKGTLPSVQDALVSKLGIIIRDVQELKTQDPPIIGKQQLLEGNTLFILPTLEANSINTVITSPPYANRYDYTRTYALELAFLGIEDEIFSLRQELLSCTVESKSKAEELREFYQADDLVERYQQTIQIVKNCAVLKEVKTALHTRDTRGEINNQGILSMIDQYFLELSFVFMELFRICKPGAKVAFVNDNVRYAGEVIPVDTISTYLAQSFGFEPQTIYVIPQRKGNSSQQMKRFGRRELRKSITIWQKPFQDKI